MDSQQIAQELRDQNDRIDRLEAAIDTIGTHFGQFHSHEFPPVIAGLTDRIERLEVADDHLSFRIEDLINRIIPASVAGVTHTVSGTNQIVADLAGTVHTLAYELHSHKDRLTLIERNWE